MNKIKELFNESIKLKQQVLADSTSVEKIIQMAESISNAIENGNKLMLCGNGGSAADAQHLAAEMVIRLRPNVNRRALPAISLAMDTSTITACGNDFSFNDIFVRSLEALANPGDVLLGISTSGNSENVRRAILRAKEIDVMTCMLSGCEGGKIKSLSDIEYIVPSYETGRIQEVHIMMGHALMESIEDKLLKNGFL
jgi:D-sedoheptulose 7-phosphate isomerase